MQMRRPALKTMSSRAFHSKRMKISVNTDRRRWSRKWRDTDMGHYNQDISLNPI